MLKRVLFIFLISSFCFLSSIFFVSPSYAAATTTNTFLEKQDAMKNGSGLEAWTNESMGNSMMSLYNGLVGDIDAKVFESGTSATSFIPGGAFGTMNKIIASLNTPPASGVEYIAQIKDSFLGKPAYAQGAGFTGLQFLLPLWRGFRNVVYVLASIIFIAIGIMIMLRVKISPQAVVTVQSAIPKLITTLILVTFSYAIAGLVIDICNLVQGLVVALLFSINGTSLSDSLFSYSQWFGESSGLVGFSALGETIASWFGGNTFSFSNLSNPNLHILQLLTYRAVPGWLSLTMLGGLLGSIVLGFFLGGIGNWALGSAGSTVFDMAGRVVGGAAGGVIGGLLIPLVLCIVVAIWLIKLYFGLLKCYVTLIFKIIFAPLEIGMGAFPNAKGGFSTWILDILANMAVFPVVGIFLVILNMVTDAVSNPANIANVWSPSLISTTFGGTTGSVSSSIISACIGLAGLALLSKLPDMVPQYIFMIKPSPWGQAIGEGLKSTYKNSLTQTGVSIGAQMGAGYGIEKFRKWREDVNDKRANETPSKTTTTAERVASMEHNKYHRNKPSGAPPPTVKK